MPTYDAGSIKASADLDRDPFIEGLRYCMQQGQEFARQKFTATASIDTAAARAELERLREQMRRLSGEDVDIDVKVIGSEAARLELARLRTEQAKYRAEMEASRAEGQRYKAQLGESRAALEQNRSITEGVRLAQIRARQELNESRSAWREYERQVGASSRATQRASKDSEKHLGLMRTAIEQLGPPLVPIAGGALALGSAFVGLGAAGILAFKGIAAEMKAGTPLGLKYAGVTRQAKDELAALEHVAAGGVLTGVEQGVRKATLAFPGLNTQIAASSRMLGDIAQHAIGGVLGGFETFGPVIAKAEGYVDKLAARFETWATGPGGAKFADTLSRDLDHLIPALSNIATLAVHLVSAFNPVGTSMLDNISALSGVLDHIPVGVLQAATVAYIAFRTSVAVTTGISAAVKALEALKAAQLGVAASSVAAARAQGAAGAAGAAGTVGLGARGAGLLATGLRYLAPVAVAWTAVTLATNAAANATERWRHSVDNAKSTFANTAHLAGDWLTGNFGNTHNDINDQRIAHQNAASQASAQAQINRFGAGTAGSPFTALSTAPQFTREGLAGLDSTREKMRALRTEWLAGAAAMGRLTAAGRDNGEGFALLSAQTQDAARRYQFLKDQVTFYTDGLRTQERVQRQMTRGVNSTRDAYATRQGDVLGAEQRGALTQNPVLTAGVGALQNYSKAVASAIKNEQTWTKVTDDNTVTIRGTKFETAAYSAALEQTHGNVTKAIGLLLGHKEALANDQVAAQGAATMQQRLSDAIGEAERKFNLTDQQVNTYAASLGITTERLATGEVSTKQFVAAIGSVKAAIDNADTATAGWVAALTQFEGAGDTAASRGNLLAAAMVSLNGTAIGYGVTMSSAAAANQQFVDAFNAADKSVVHLKTGFIDFKNAGAAPVLQALQQLQTTAAAAAAATYQDEVTTRGRTRASKDAAAVYWNDTHGALIAEAKQLHITHGEAEKLANRYFHWPKDAKTRLELMGTEGTNKLLNGIGEQLAILTGKPWISTLTADDRDGKAKIADYQARINAIKQGRVPNLGANTAAARAEIARLQAAIDRLRGKTVYINENTITTRRSGGNSGAHTAAMGGLWRAFAHGGLENHAPQIAKTQPGSVRIWAEPETRGEAYIPLANDHRRPAARDIAAQTVALLGGVAFFAAGGFNHVTGGGGSSSGSSGSSSAGGSSSSAGNASLLRSLTTLYRQIKADRLGTDTLTQLDKLSSSTLTSYAAALLKQVQRASDLKAAPSALVKRVTDENKALTAALRVRDTIAARKKQIDADVASATAAYNQERDTVSAASMSGFDITSSGNGYSVGIKASLEQQLAAAKHFQGDLAAARKMHLDAGLIRQFAEKGPDSDANLEAIINAGQGYVNDINKDYSQLAATAKATGVAEANVTNGAKLNEELAKQRKVNEEQRDATRVVNSTLKHLRGDLERLRQDVADARRHNGGHR